MIKKFLAFTLGEILIALTVIGVVAVLVMPQLVLGQKAAKAKAQFNTAYAILAKSIAEMDADEVSTDPKNYVKAGAFYPILKQYQKVTIDCGVYAATNDSVCISTTNRDNSSDYTIRKNNNTKMNAYMLDDGAFVINNGMLFVIENPANNPNGLLVSIDINGKNNRPNKWGWDLFTFEIVKGDVLPVGAPGTTAAWSTNPATYCDANSNSDLNGMTCGYYASTDQDYFKKLYNGH